MAKVRPLKSKTMTLDELQRRTMAVLRKVKRQLRRQAHEDGLSDSEFIEHILDPLEGEIMNDRQVLKMHDAKSKAKTT